MNKKILDMINLMDIDEMKTRLVEYMSSDEKLMPHPIGVEVRLRETSDRSGRYEVILLMDDNSEVEVKFHDRYSRLVYVYTLLHPKGYQRRKLVANNYRALCNLYSMLYFRDSEALLKTIDSTDIKKPGHFMNQYIAQARKAIRQASPLAEQFAIDRPQHNNGKVLIPFVANGGTVVIDASLCNDMSHL